MDKDKAAPRHDDARSDDQSKGDHSGQGPRDSEHRDGARTDAEVDRAIDRQSQHEKEERRRPGQPV